MAYVESVESDAEGTQHPIPLGPIGCFRDRLKTVMGSTGARAFGRNVGLSEGAIRGYLSGMTYPTLDRLAQIAEACGVSAMWLAFGIDEHAAAQEGSGRYITDSQPAGRIPLYDARCRHIEGTWRDRAVLVGMLDVSGDELRQHGLDAASLGAVRVDGDAMEGLARSGDTVMFDHSRNQVEADAVYVIRLDGTLQVKRLQRQFDGSVTILSHHKAYRDIVVPRAHLSDLDVVGRAVWAGVWLS